MQAPTGPNHTRATTYTLLLLMFTPAAFALAVFALNAIGRTE
jgi:hypothetical protein